ncbi:hypothetical protein VTJ49DRAFT_2132 [Mycothermus thermophilus]|uniref:SRP54-type proteins GTP-binding domain-containing protein n=1 Tax=Humicola insolens TaxID=85995 RepID=A0ABR3VN09_HUMIN
MATPNSQTGIIDDKTPLCVPFILDRLAEFDREHANITSFSPPRPFILGLNGVQGVGKTTLVRSLASTLQIQHNLPTLVASIDDFYLTHADQLRLAAQHPDNPLIQHRGEPGTHDLALLDSFLTSLLKNHHPTPIPRYDKSAHAGQGDRLPPSEWPSTDPSRTPRVVILEGWCVGFRALGGDELCARWQVSRSRSSSTTLSSATDGSNRSVGSHLARHDLPHLRFINDQLSHYETVLNARLDAFIHIDAQDLQWVYAWRAEQEAELRRVTGSGKNSAASTASGGAMTEEQVARFVDAYMPAYELYVDGVREGVFLSQGRRGKQLRIVVGRDRMVVESVVV